MLIALALALSDAHAADPTWAWPEDERRRFYVESTLGVPIEWWYRLPNNQVRVSYTRLRFVTTCGVVSATEDAWRLRCDLDDLELLASQSVEGEGDLAAVLTEYERLLQDAYLQVRLGRDGRLLGVDLEGFSKRDAAWAGQHEMLRLMFRRALAGLELTPPEVSDSPWTARDWLVVSSPYDMASVSTARMAHTPRWEGESTLVVESEGRGTVALGDGGRVYLYGGNPVLGAQGVAYTVDAWATGRFDTASGSWLERSWAAIGAPTNASTVQGNPYVQGGYLRLLGPDEAAPAMGPSAPWGDGVAEVGSDMALREWGEVLVERELVDDAPLPFRKDPHLWVAVGPGVHLNNALSRSAGGWVSAGWRFPMLVSAGVFGRYDLGGRFHDLYRVSDRAVGAGLWFDTSLRVSPRLGVLGGVTSRRFEQGDPGAAWIPFVGPEVGVSGQLTERFAVNLVGRAPIDFTQVMLHDDQSSHEAMPRVSADVALEISVRVF